MARVSRRRCSKSARLSVGDALGVEVGARAAGAAGDTAGPVRAAAPPVCLAGRGSVDDFAFAELGCVGGLSGGGWSEPLLVVGSAWRGGAAVGGVAVGGVAVGGIDCGAETGGTGTGAACGPSLVEVP